MQEDKSLEYFIEKYSVPEHEVFNRNPKLIELYIPKSHTDWNTFRKNGIGASEVGVVVGVNHYKVLPQLVEEKVGTRDAYVPTNEAMLSGLLAEKIILRRWKYYDGTDLGYIDDLMKEISIDNEELLQLTKRTCQPMNTYIINTDYPFLFVSLDARVDPNQTHLSGVIVDKEWPLEVKTIRQYEAAKWLDGVPSMYRFQVQTQMLVTETDYAELAVLEDGSKFKVIPFKKDQDMQEIIVNKSEETYQLIRRLRTMREEIMYYLNEGQVQKANKLQAEFDSHLPLPHDEEAAKEYYSQKMLIEHPEFMGSETDRAYVRERQRINEFIKGLEKEKQLYENLIMRTFSLEKCEYMTLGTNGKVRYHKVEGRKNYQLDFRAAKDLVDKNSIEFELNKIINK
jgi:hypothetical protein